MLEADLKISVSGK